MSLIEIFYLYIIAACDIGMAVKSDTCSSFYSKRCFSPSLLRSIMETSYCVCGCSYISLKNIEMTMYIIKKSNILKNLGGSDYIIYWVALFMDLLIIISKFHLCFSFLNIWDTPLKRKNSFLYLSSVLWKSLKGKEKCVTWTTVSKSLPLPYKSDSQTWTCKGITLKT